MSTHVHCCHLKRKREADAFKPSGAQLCIDERVKTFASPLDSRQNVFGFHSCKMASNQRLFPYFLVPGTLQAAAI